MTPLLAAASNLHLLTDNKTAILQQLLSAGASVQDMCSAGRTALHYAAQWGFTDAVQLLLQAGANVAAVDADGLTPLSYAVLHPRWAAQAGLIMCADVPGLFGMFFPAGASVSEVNARDEEGQNALQLAAMCSFSSRGTYLRALVSAGVDINAANKKSWTTLHCAVTNDDVSTVTDLLSLGAAADVPDPRGKTALSVAARKAAKHPSWPTDLPWVLIFKALWSTTAERHSQQPLW
jgi:ankyrin repeat protein